MIETLQQAAVSLLQARAAQATEDFRRSVRPMLASEPERNPVIKHAGTCILLEIDSHKVLATAAHILDRRPEGTLLFVSGPPGTNPVLIDGGIIGTTKSPPGGRDFDAFDCGFWIMPEGAVRALGAVEFVNASRTSHNRAPTERRYYTAMGYALSRNNGLVDRRARTIAHRLSRYSGSLVQLPQLAAELGVSGEEHLFLNYEKRANSFDGGRVQAFEPKGLSGGPLIDLGDFTAEGAYARDLTYRASLSGMLIEHRRKHRAIVAVKIQYVERSHSTLARLNSPIRPGLRLPYHASGSPRSLPKTGGWTQGRARHAAPGLPGGTTQGGPRFCRRTPQTRTRECPTPNRGLLTRSSETITSGIDDEIFFWGNIPVWL
jgi:hypothetical protein